MKLILSIILCFSFFFTGVGAEDKYKFEPLTIQSFETITNLNTSSDSKWYISIDELDPLEFSKRYLDFNENPANWIEHKIPSQFNKYKFGKPEIHTIWIAKSIFIPENYSGNSISIRLGYISDRDRAYFNGELIGSTGAFGSGNPQGYDKIRIYEIPDRLIMKGRENLLLVQVEEYFYETIGIDQDKTEIGPTKLIGKSFLEDEYLKLLLLVIYLTVGLYFLFIYLRRRKENENLLYAVFTILFVSYQFMRTQFKHEFGIDFVYLKKIEYLVMAPQVTVFTHFVRIYFDYKWSTFQKILDSIILSIVIYTLFFTDVRQYNLNTVWVVQPIWIVYLGVIFYYLIKEMLRKNRDALLMFLGAIVIGFAAVFDILITRGILVFPRISGYAFIFFILNLAVILANRFVRMSEEIESLNKDLEKKVALRTEELSHSLEDVRKLKISQDGDYFLTSLLIKPLGRNHAEKSNVQVDFIVKQKKTFEFKNRLSDLGGDLCRSENIILDNRKMTVFFNADAMGKSMQGAGGALVMGSVFDSILERTRLHDYLQKEYPEKWLKNAFIELHNVFESFQGSMLVSIVMGVVDNDTGLMYFINAEHPFSVIFRDGKASFIDEEFIFRKLGTEITENFISIKLFQMKNGDIIINGSDGRDDILIKDKETGVPVLNYDHTIFLKTVEESGGDIHRIVENLGSKSELTDDLSLLSIKYETSKNDEIDSHEIRAGFVHLLQEKKFTEATARIKEYISENPFDTEAIFLLSFAYKKSGKFSDAIREGERVRLREAHHARNLINLARAYARVHNLERAKYLLAELPDPLERERELKRLDS